MPTTDKLWEEWFRTSSPIEIIGIKNMMRSAFEGGIWAGIKMAYDDSKPLPEEDSGKA